MASFGRIYQQAKEYWGDETVARAHAKAAALLETEKTVRKLATETGSAVAQAQSERCSPTCCARQESFGFDSAGKVTDEVEKSSSSSDPAVAAAGRTLTRRPRSTSARRARSRRLVRSFRRVTARCGQVAVFGNESYKLPNVRGRRGREGARQTGEC